MDQPTPVIIDFDVSSITEYNILPTNWFDLINTVSSSYSIRPNFKFINETYIGGTFSYRTYTEPFNGYGDAFINDLTGNYLSPDQNQYTYGAFQNSNSLKVGHNEYGCGFSRKLYFNSIEPSTYSLTYTQSTIIKVYFDPGQGLVQQGDRVMMVKTDGFVPEYNTYGIVISESSINGWMVLDIPYHTAVSTTQSGYVYEGCAFYDYAIVNGKPQITTLNNHNLNAGDQIVIQMDNQGRASVEITASIGQSLSGIFVNGINLMGGVVVTYTTTFANFMADIRNAINESNPIESFRAYVSFGLSNTLYIFTGRYTDFAYEGSELTYSGTVTTFTSSNVTYLGKIDELGRGYNPQITGVYTVDEVISPTEFTLPDFISVYYSNEPYTDRGTIYSLTDYKFTNLTVGSTYSHLFASIDNESDIRPINSLEGLFNKFKMDQATPSYYMSARTLPSNGGYLQSDKSIYNYDFYDTYELFTVDVLKDTTNLANNVNEFVVTRVFDNSTDVITFSNIATTGNKWTLGIGPWNLNEFFSLSPGDVSVFTNPGTDNFPIPVDIVSYTIAGYHKTTSSVKVTKDFKFSKKCSDRETFQLCWYNCYGGWDYYTFISPLQKTYKISRSNFYKNGNYRSGVTQVTSDTRVTGETAFRIDKSLELKLTTSFLSLDECKVIESLMSSSEIYLIMPETPHDSTKRFSYPVVIINDQFKLVSPVSKLRLYEIDIRMAGYNYFNRSTIN